MDFDPKPIFGRKKPKGIDRSLTIIKMAWLMLAGAIVVTACFGNPQGAAECKSTLESIIGAVIRL